MDIVKATVLYLSGTGTTEKYARAFAEGLPYDVEVVPLRHDEEPPCEFGSDELLVLAVPVFAGYAPKFVWERLAHMRGSHTPCALLAVYGARDYDNALVEMSGKLASKGFVTVGAAALVAQHSIVPSIATGRPSDADLDSVAAFAATIGERLDGMASIADAPVFSFKGEMGTGAAPGIVPAVVEEYCIDCSTCAWGCPAYAIEESSPIWTDPERCISCMRCIVNCPSSARMVPEPVLAGASTMLAEVADPLKANEFF